MKQSIYGRPFTPDEQRILTCNGIPATELDRMRLYGRLPAAFAAANAYHDATEPAQARQHVYGVTLMPAAIPRNRFTMDVDQTPQTAEIHIDAGLAPMTSNQRQMDTIAHEAWHGHSYLRGQSSPESILFAEYPHNMAMPMRPPKRRQPPLPIR